MPDEDVKKLIIKENNKIELIKQAIEENAIYKRMVEVLADFPSVKLSLDSMAEAYMDFSSSQNTLDNNDYYSIDEQLISQILAATTYEISKEENGVVLDANGEIDLEASIQQQMMGQYSYSSSSEELTVEQQEMLAQGLSSIFNEPQKEDATNDIIQFFMNTSNFTREEQITHLREMSLSQEAEKAEKANRKLSFLNTKADVQVMRIALDYYHEMTKELPSLTRLKRYEGVARKIPEMERFFDENGDFNKMLVTSTAIGYIASYAEKESSKTVRKYAEEGMQYEDLDSKEQEKLLQSAYLLFEGNNVAEKKIAIEVLRSISLDCVEISKDKKSVVLNERVFENLFNATQHKLTRLTMQDIRTKINADSVQLAIRQVRDLNGKIKRNEFEEYRESNDMTEDEKAAAIAALVKRNKEKYKPKFKISDIDRTKARIEKLLQGKTANEIQRIVLVSYSKAKYDNDSGQMNLLEQYILSQPNLYGNYINGENGIQEPTPKDSFELWKDKSVLEVLEGVDELAKRIEIKESNPFSLENIRDTAEDLVNRTRSFAKRVLGPKYKALPKAVEREMKKEEITESTFTTVSEAAQTQITEAVEQGENIITAIQNGVKDIVDGSKVLTNTATLAEESIVQDEVTSSGIETKASNPWVVTKEQLEAERARQEAAGELLNNKKKTTGEIVVEDSGVIK